MDKALELHIGDARKLVSDVNYRCALLGLKALNPETGRQKIRCWLPEQIKALLIEEHGRPEDEKTGVALIKYFCGPGTWWFSEYDPETQMFYGLAEIQFKELGYASMRELRETRVSGFLWVERDYWFEPTPPGEL